jgi:hypothetical protein
MHCKKHLGTGGGPVGNNIMAGASCAKEAIWLKQLLHDLGFPQNGPIHIYSDNQSSISLAKNPSRFHDRSKHIDLRYKFLQEKVETKDIVLEYIPTAEMIADIFTKALPKPKHELCTHGLGVLKHS